MDGEKFIFKQNKPVAIEIKKIEDKITLQKENSQPIELDSSSGSNNEIIFLFGNPDMVKDKYKVEKKEAADEDIYTVIPIKKEKIVLIIVIAKEDKVKKMDIKFLDASNLIYEFKNTVTGVKPNEEFFK